MNNEEARHEVESETSKRKHGKPSKNAEKEREWTMSACITPNHQHTSTKKLEIKSITKLLWRRKQQSRNAEKN